MSLINSKEKILAGACLVSLLGMSPQAFAGGNGSPLPMEQQQATKKITVGYPITKLYLMQ